MKRATQEFISNYHKVFEIFRIMIGVKDETYYIISGIGKFEEIGSRIEVEYCLLFMLEEIVEMEEKRK